MEIKRLDHTRILMYSHDTFGLGHLRRCRAIAHAIVEQYKGVSVLIISGSQIAGAFDFKARVDFVKIPSVIKLYNGEYDSIGEYIDIEEILEMRKLIIQRTAEAFNPDIFIVDKEPMGLKGELEPTLTMFKDTKTVCVLGLRDVMDSPKMLAEEWSEQSMLKKIDRYYDNVWIYGPQHFWNPLEGFEITVSLKKKLKYVGFLDRETQALPSQENYNLPDKYILVTAGGGGDGIPLMEQVLSAREHDPQVDFPLVMVLGPFMKSESRDRLRLRASRLANVTIIDFESRMEMLMQNAIGLVGMCGYNTFCEVLSYNRKALFVPRTKPREEQYIRAKRATELGMCSMLTPEEASIPSVMATALRGLPTLNSPAQALSETDLSGLDQICLEVQKMSENRKKYQTNIKPSTQPEEA